MGRRTHDENNTLHDLPHPPGRGFALPALDTVVPQDNAHPKALIEESASYSCKETDGYKSSLVNLKDDDTLVASSASSAAKCKAACKTFAEDNSYSDDFACRYYSSGTCRISDDAKEGSVVNGEVYSGTLSDYLSSNDDYTNYSCQTN